MSLTATVSASINAKQTRALDLISGVANLSKTVSASFTDGAGADQANLIWSDGRQIAASSNEDLDLSGSLTDVHGQAVVFARIKAILIKAAAGNTNNVRLTRPASNGVPLFLAAGDGIDIQPDGVFLWMAPTAAGVAVTASTGDLLNVANSSSGSVVDYEVVIIGAAS